MKISRISQALGSISDEFSREAIEEFDTKSAKINNTVPEKPRVIREEKSRKTPIVIALAGLCAAAAIAVPLVLKNVDKNALLSGAASSAAVEKLGYDLDGSEDYREYKFEFTMPEYEGVDFECTHYQITANGEVIASGMPILQVYLADLNGDGRREIVCYTGCSGNMSNVINVCDYSEKQLYILFSRGIESWLDLFENNGELWVRETEFRTKNVLSEKKLEISDMKKIDGFTQVEEKAYCAQVLTSKNMTVRIDRLRVSMKDGALCDEAEYDMDNPNVSFLTIDMNTYGNKCTKFAIVMDEDGNFELFEGDQVSDKKDNSDTSFLEKLPENKFGYMWECIDGNWQWSNSVNSDKLHDHLTIEQSDEKYVGQLWISNNDEIREMCRELFSEYSKFAVRIKDNGDGTFSVDGYVPDGDVTNAVKFQTSDDISAILENVRNSLIEKTSLSADEAKYYVQNYACYDLDFDGEAEVLVVNTFGSPAVHVFERNGTTYEESSVFPMKALEYTGYKLELNPYQNGDERYYYFRFFSGGGTMEADVLGAIKQTESGYEMEYLYSWGTLDYKGIPEPVRKEFYRKGWDKYDLALADSNPNDIPKEELAAILKNYGITLN